jgi:hypothetical protein
MAIGVELGVMKKKVKKARQNYGKRIDASVGERMSLTNRLISPPKAASPDRHKKSPGITFLSESEMPNLREAELDEIRKDFLPENADDRREILQLALKYGQCRSDAWAGRDVEQFRNWLSLLDASKTNSELDDSGKLLLGSNSSMGKKLSAVIDALERMYGRDSTYDQWQRAIFRLQGHHKEDYTKPSIKPQMVVEGGQGSELPGGERQNQPQQPARDRSGYVAPTRIGKVGIKGFLEPKGHANLLKLGREVGLTAEELTSYLGRTAPARASSDKGFREELVSEGKRVAEEKKRVAAERQAARERRNRNLRATHKALVKRTLG